MKRINLFTAVMAGLAASISGAQAQSAQPTVNWSGFYIGGHGGYQWSTIDLGFERDLPGIGNNLSLDTDDGMGGIHGGVQQQFGNWVIGAELSGDWGNNNSTANGIWEFDGLSVLDPPDIVIPPICGFFGCFGGGTIVVPPGLVGPFGFGEESLQTSMDQLFLAVGRVGYAWDNVLISFKGGFASAEFSTAAAFAGEGGVCAYANCLDIDAFPPTGSLVTWSGSGSTEKRHFGFALGAAMEMMFWQNVSFGVDYTYVNLGSETHRGTLNGDLSFCPDCGFDFATDYKFKVDPDDIHYVNARLTLHFNGPSP